MSLTRLKETGVPAAAVLAPPPRAPRWEVEETKLRLGDPLASAFPVASILLRSFLQHLGW